MPAPDYALLLDPPAFPAERYAALADRLAALMSTSNDVLLIQAEAVLALEAAATSLARPGLKALNVVTSPYGTWFGGWLEKGGATVRNLTASPARPVTLEEVERALDEGPDFDLLAIVHAESASGILNPLPAIAALARERGIATLVDAVASIGGHAFDVDRLGIDIAVIGPQKALAGPAGISAISVSERAWALLSHDGAPDNSMLSLMDQKKLWLDAGRGALPGTPAPLEFYALEAALDRIESEGLASANRRHKTAATATRNGLRALGIPTWVEEAHASALVSTAILPDTLEAKAFLAAVSQKQGADISGGVGPGAERLIRLNHTGRRAHRDAVKANILAFSGALKSLGHAANTDFALEAAEKTYLDAPADGV
ncbi:pyridoxal-phosphate-dependent aminotransferase family protein [Agrobacterium pusense]|uniref:pyridoxal-phosphate-dependent aminotransferase family protein n=1 Tax=Agrobacterium pusense TaxID=648995 RepID=UPI000885644B|nr:aminotransferase class V-fold PLP-dependent enzyme [Agrobacterium pusense]OOO21892.1 aspartate aminotransferase [Agrobacterium pusense]WKD44036.1 aminotransferase class V-fold PLP-dependent enzyme [Agrobacterium pusense]SDE87496.1 L-aspartate aminotransferase apoenzyme [Agrobacterium pusense]